MARGSPEDIAVVAADVWIGRLLEDFVASRGWRAVPVAPVRVERELGRLRASRVILCDLDLWPRQLDLVRSVGRPLIYFSSSSRLRYLGVPADAAAAIELPPNWAELHVLIRSLL
ncbi:MAG TPA: hypothetical protein VF212_14885 [Longimicrobiales bacterium]